MSNGDPGFVDIFSYVSVPIAFELFPLVYAHAASSVALKTCHENVESPWSPIHVLRELRIMAAVVLPQTGIRSTCFANISMTLVSFVLPSMETKPSLVST